MNELVKQVTPLTRAIIWLTKDESDLSNQNYKDIDYLVDGLLTANVRAAQKVSSRVIVGTSFTKALFVMVISEYKVQELNSFIALIQKDLGPEQDIIVIDELNAFDHLKNELKALSNNLRIFS